MTLEPLLILGGNGRIGRVLRNHQAAFQNAGLAPSWQSRTVSSDYLHWDILTQPCPAGAARGVVLCLAGVIRGEPEALALNVDLAMAACRAAAEQGARHVFLVSSAGVYSPSSELLTENSDTTPDRPYCVAKLAMERAALAWRHEGGPGLTILRIGNIAGLDALLGGVRPGQTAELDRIEGQVGGPLRSYIGPATLASVIAQLVGRAAKEMPLPPVLNVAAGPAVSMASLLDAAEVEWAYREPADGVIPRVEFDLSLLRAFVDIPPGSWQAETMVAEWRGLAK
jgi:nucleoside-diphosphate-sugar epimerase